MTNKKTSELAASAGIANTDLFMMVDVSDTSMAASGTNVKPTVAEIISALVSLGSLYKAGGTDVAVADGGTGASDASTARTNLGVDYTTLDERTRDTIGTALVAGTGVTVTVNDGSDTITIASVLSEALTTVAASSTAQTVNVSSYGIADITLTGNMTLTLSGATAGSVWSLSLILRQDGTGSRLVTWPTTTKWHSGVAPTLSTTASAIDLVNLLTIDGGTTWFGTFAGKGMA